LCFFVVIEVCVRFVESPLAVSLDDDKDGCAEAGPMLTENGRFESLSGRHAIMLDEQTPPLPIADTRVAVSASPLLPGVSPVRIRYRDAGSGPPLVVLHSGWGYGIYPFNQQLAALNSQRRILIPDRTGYGQSEPLDVFPTDFHQRAAEETLAFFDALGIERASVWGHSDGAVIALRLGLTAPHRVTVIAAEATHFFKRKPRSRSFFEAMRHTPERFGERVVETLQRDHGERWRAVVAADGDAWLRIADEAASEDADLYDGQLPRLQVPVLLVHGARDPRTEPGEIDALCAALNRRSDELRARSRILLLPDGSHSPHSERATAAVVTSAAREFLDGVDSTGSSVVR
jgi:pimeloyl-ACP methyl ester carboxylesterase